MNENSSVKKEENLIAGIDLLTEKENQVSSIRTSLNLSAATIEDDEDDPDITLHRETMVP